MATVARATASRSKAWRRASAYLGRPRRARPRPAGESIMESDEQVNENLKMQFKTLQEQQRKRMQNQMEKKRGKQQDAQNEIFGVPDDLALSTVVAEEVAKEDFSKRLLEDENEQLQQQLRETLDENGRLYKLLKERDFEIKQLQKQIEEERLALTGTDGMTGDIAASKIVQLAKQNRHLTAEAEKEKTKVKQLNNRIKGLEKELHLSTAKLQSHGGKDSQPVCKTAEAPLSPEMKALQEKLSAVNLKTSEYRNQLQTAKQELKVVQKLLASEVGEEVSIQHLMANPGSWRGRAQQILTLQGKVRELEGQLGHSRSGTSLSSRANSAPGLSDPGKKSAQRNLQWIRNLEKEKKDALEKLTNEHSALQKDHEEMKKKLDASKARNQVLSSEVKTLKQQISTLLDKGKHDDELIDALLSQQKEMQVILKNLGRQEEKNKESPQILNVPEQKLKCDVEQFRQILAERESQVRELEKRIAQLTLQSHLQEPEDGRSDSTSTLSAESLEEDNCTAAPRKADCTGRSTSAQIVSHLGHTLVDSAATSLPASIAPGRPVGPDELDAKSLKSQIVEYKALCHATEVERDSLLKMVGVLQKRAEESSAMVWEAEQKLQEQQCRCIALEQQLERRRAEAVENSGRPESPSDGGAAFSASAGQSLGDINLSWNADEKKEPPADPLSEEPQESQIQDLSSRLAVQMDNNAVLKIALENMVKLKGEDFQMYQETMSKIKVIFLQALRQQKQDCS